MIFTVKELPVEYMAVTKLIAALRERLRFSTSDTLHRWTRLLARTTAARAMVGTNVMEGVNVTMDDAIAAIDGEMPLSEEEADLQAVLSYWRAMTYIVGLSKDPSYVHNADTIKSIHYMMLSHDLKVHPGRYRPGGIHITNIPANKIVYEGPDIELVPGLMNELVEYLKTTSDIPLIKASMAHLNLTMIHPFSDGNGRMARALQTMVLSREGILDPQFSSIEEYIGNHSLQYYDVLAQVGQGSWNPDRDPLPWLRFSLTSHFRQANNLLRRLADMTKLWQALELETKMRKMNDRVVSALADAAMGLKVRNNGYRSQADISNQQAKYDLKALADEGLLLPIGERRGRFYLAGPLVQDIRKKTKSEWKDDDPFVLVEQSREKSATPELPGILSE